MRLLFGLFVMFALTFGVSSTFACDSCDAHSKKAAEKCACGFDKGSAECTEACKAKESGKCACGFEKGSEECAAACGKAKTEGADDDDSSSSESEDESSDEEEAEQEGEHDSGHEGHNH